MDTLDQALEFTKTALGPPGQPNPAEKLTKRFWRPFKRFMGSPDVRQQLGQYKPENELEHGYSPAALHVMYGQYLGSLGR